MRQIRILYVHHRGEPGGAPRSLALSIGGLTDHVEAMVLCPKGPVTEEFRATGAMVRVAPVAAFTSAWSAFYHGWRWGLLAPELFNLRAHLRAVHTAIRDFQPDLVHLNEFSLLPAAWAAARAGKPLVWHLRTSLPEPRPIQARLVRREVARRAAAAIAINDGVAASFAPLARAIVLPNPVVVPEQVVPAPSAAAKARLGLDPGLPAVGMLGNLYAAKGWLDLVHAAARVLSSGTEIQVVLVGGFLRSSEWHRSLRGRLISAIAGLEDAGGAFRKEVGRLGLEHRIRVIPFVQRVDQIYEALDVVCFPSRGPEVGRPVLEAQAHGRPVILSGSVDGAGVLIPDVTGLVVPHSDPDALANAIGRVIRNPSLGASLGREGRLKAQHEFAQEVVAAKLLAVYRAVLRRDDIPGTAPEPSTRRNAVPMS